MQKLCRLLIEFGINGFVSVLTYRIAVILSQKFMTIGDVYWNI